jgi:hypothetical protein
MTMEWFSLGQCIAQMLKTGQFKPQVLHNTEKISTFQFNIVHKADGFMYTSWADAQSWGS